MVLPPCFICVIYIYINMFICSLLFFWSYTKHHKFNCESFLLTEQQKEKMYCKILFIISVSRKGWVFIFDCRKSSFFLLVVSGNYFLKNEIFEHKLKPKGKNLKLCIQRRNFLSCFFFGAVV